jgi:O-antigen/teichoic acid export membrane protein
MRLALLTVAAGLAIALLILAVSRPARLTPDLLPVTVLWTVLYAVYALSRSHLYAERRVRQALVLELAGFASFAAALAVSRARPVLWWLPFAVYPLPVAGRALALWMRGPLSGRLGDWPGLTRFATLAFLGSASSLGIQYGSTLVIGATGGAASAGVWATLTSIAAPVLLLPRSLSTLYLPRLAKLTLASREAFETMSAKHLRMATMCALPIVALFALLGPYALPSVLGGSQDRTVLATWTILCTSTYVVCRKEPLITAVAALGRAGVNATAAFVGATACAIVWILAPMFIPQLLAVAAGALVQAFGTPTVAAWLAQRRDAAHRVRWSIRLSDAAMLTVAALSLLAPLDPRAVLSGILVVLVATSIEIWHARTADRALGPS